MESAIYVGSLRHRRFEPVAHAFSYRLFMLYLDLSELPALFERARWWSATRPAIARFHRADHLGEPNVPLERSVRDLVEERSGVRPTGPIRLLTQLRYLGYGFNPVSFYYCYDAQGTTLETIVAEINNTPWGEQHCYVLRADEATPSPWFRFELDKEFHVSPFMPMDVSYDWRFRAPAESLLVHMTNLEAQHKLFDATLRLRRRPITPRNLNRLLLRYPVMSVQVITAIYWQAFKLWWKNCPFYPHPATTPRDLPSRAP